MLDSSRLLVCVPGGSSRVSPLSSRTSKHPPAGSGKNHALSEPEDIIKILVNVPQRLRTGTEKWLCPEQTGQRRQRNTNDNHDIHDW